RERDDQEGREVERVAAAELAPAVPEVAEVEEEDGRAGGDREPADERRVRRSRAPARAREQDDRRRRREEADAVVRQDEVRRLAVDLRGADEVDVEVARDVAPAEGPVLGPQERLVREQVAVVRPLAE